jgi:hypothetical protein
MVKWIGDWARSPWWQNQPRTVRRVLGQKTEWPSGPDDGRKTRGQPAKKEKLERELSPVMANQNLVQAPGKKYWQSESWAPTATEHI